MQDRTWNFQREADVYLCTPPTSPLDVNFRLFGIPVRVHPLFWLIMALFGNGVFQAFGIEFLLIWVLCGFLSILLHEIGHALVARSFGATFTRITLIAFGGLAENSPIPRKAWQRILISAAGPGMNFLIVALVEVILVTQAAFVQRSQHLAATLFFLQLMNMFWGIFNLLPIWPMDGGRISRELFYMAGNRRPDLNNHILSIGMAGFLCFYGILLFTGYDLRGLNELLPAGILRYLRPSLMMTFWFGLFALENYRMLDYYKFQSGYSDDDYDDTPPWRR